MMSYISFWFIKILDAFGQIAVVKDKSSTPSFALGIVGMSVAALVAAAGASLRREEE